MGKRRSKSIVKLLKTELYSLVQSLIHKIKPTLLALVFILISGYVTQFLDSGELNFCTVGKKPQPLYALAVSYLTHNIIPVGQRTLYVTDHAALRMIQRSVGFQNIQHVVRVGKLFAYRHSNLIKIGYYDEVSKLFIAVDQRHRKIVTVIAGVPAQYVTKLINLK